MKKVLLEEKLIKKKGKDKYSILLKNPKKIKRYKFKVKSNYNYISSFKYFILSKSLYIILLLYIYYLESNSKINSFISYYIKQKPFNNIKVGLCVIGKKENLYVKEYVTHYKQLGYNHIFIYDNNDIKDEKFEDVLKEEINSNFVSIINFRGKSALHITRGPQCLAFRHCYDKNRNEYDWLSFFDFDEFLEIGPNANSIQEFLGNPRYDKCQNIKINFLVYDDNNLLYYDNRPVQERFTNPLYNHPSNNMVKSTVRGRLEHNYWRIKCNVHTSKMNVTNCNSQGNVIPFDTGQSSPINHTFAAIKHYYTKSVEEYVEKTKRGDSFVYKGYNNYWKKKRIKLYFGYNNYSTEKENLFKKLFQIKDL